MARKTVYLDDLTGKEIAEGEGGPVRFSLNDDFFELDLGKESMAKLERALAPYIEKANMVDGPQVIVEPMARPRGRPRGATHGQKPKTDREQLQAMREWLRGQGHEVSDRGRIAAHLQELYHAAHKS
jgi:hypothetical protein